MLNNKCEDIEDEILIPTKDEAIEPQKVIRSPPVTRAIQENRQITKAKPKWTYEDSGFEEILFYEATKLEGNKYQIKKKSAARLMYKYQASHPHFFNDDFMIIYGEAYLNNRGVNRLASLDNVEEVVNDIANGVLIISFKWQYISSMNKPKHSIYEDKEFINKLKKFDRKEYTFDNWPEGRIFKITKQIREEQITTPLPVAMIA